MNDEFLQGRVALVTGSAARTGEAILRALADAGADVIIHYRRSGSDADTIAAELKRRGRRALALQADFEKPGGPESLIHRLQAQMGRLDIIVNNIGNYPLDPPLAQRPETMRATLETNLVAPYALVRAAMPLLERSDNAHVINLGYAGSEYPLAHARAMTYQISKTGLLIMTRSLAQVLGPKGIRVNMVSPGHLENSVDLPEDIAAHVPLGRAGAEADIANAVKYLLSEAGGYITGANLEVSGGYRMSLSDTI